MKKGLAIWVLAIVCFPLHARVLHVKEGGSGNGSSWASAFSNPQQALSVAKAGDEIWVATGIYTPTQGTDRTATFQLPEGVALYGGFAGFETSLNERNIGANRTILSGNIGSKNLLTDNVYTVVTIKNVTNQTILDGFTISEGMSDAIGKTGEASTSGAGLYNEAASPTIRNCVFTDNQANWGAAMFNSAGAQKCSPVIINCEFRQNKAHMDGGAIYNDGADGRCTPQIRNCHFEMNMANYGASIYNMVNNGETRPMVMTCTFINNSSMVRGAGTYDNRRGKGACETILSGCRFEENIAALDANNSATTSQQSTHGQIGGATSGSYLIKGNK